MEETSQQLVILKYARSIKIESWQYSLYVLVVRFFTLTVLRYNSAGQLFCVLCNVPVKSAILWDSHVLGKKHKEVIMELRLCLFLGMFMFIMFIIVHIYTQLFTS